MCDLQLVDMKATHRSEEHTSELQSLAYLVCRLLLEKKNTTSNRYRRPRIRSCYTTHSQRSRRELYTSVGLFRAHTSLSSIFLVLGFFFFFNDTATTEIYTLSLHDALPI